MRAGILYYSSTGNTALAVESVARRLPVQTELFDISKRPVIDIEGLDVVGFATPTDFWGLPRVFEDFVERLPQQRRKPAFVLNTYGGVSGKTLSLLGQLVATKGFLVIAAHSVHMPDSYPPLMAWGIRARNAPVSRELKRVGEFVSVLSKRIEELAAGEDASPVSIRVGPLNQMIPVGSRDAGRKALGGQRAEPDRCTRCGTCALNCPVQAVTLNPLPVFDEAACRGCWRCFNRCPAHAIRVGAYTGGAFYRGPDSKLKGKFGSASA